MPALQYEELAGQPSLDFSRRRAVGVLMRDSAVIRVGKSCRLPRNFIRKLFESTGAVSFGCASCGYQLIPACPHRSPSPSSVPEDFASTATSTRWNT